MRRYLWCGSKTESIRLNTGRGVPAANGTLRKRRPNGRATYPTTVWLVTRKPNIKQTIRIGSKVPDIPEYPSANEEPGAHISHVVTAFPVLRYESLINDVIVTTRFRAVSVMTSFRLVEPGERTPRSPGSNIFA